MIWAIADLHLSHARPKPMDIFGPHWKGHPERIAAAWRACVGDDDWVLIAGDLSWAMKLPEALVDLEWLDALPGHKVLIRGNHDYWCDRRVNPLRRHMPPSITLLGADAVDIGTAVVCGTRGWVVPGARGYDPTTDEPIYRRELNLLDRALAHGRQLAGGEKPLLVLLHYPPFFNRRPTEFAQRISAGGAAACLYGHLHQPHDWAAAVQGPVDGVDYQLTAADYLGFRPALVQNLTVPKPKGSPPLRRP